MTQESIEEKLKQIEGRNYCRACEHFIRVNFDTYKNVVHRQGFCILGRLEGDYSLYVSCSASECMGFLFSQKHHDIQMAEQKLSDEDKEFGRSVSDKRSKNYKLIEPLIKDTQKYIEDMKVKHVGLAYVMEMREVEITAHKYFYETRSDNYRDVFNMVSLRKSDYCKFLAKISVKIHDEFCKCDKIEFKENGENSK